MKLDIRNYFLSYLERCAASFARGWIVAAPFVPANKCLWQCDVCRFASVTVQHTRQRVDCACSRGETLLATDFVLPPMLRLVARISKLCWFDSDQCRQIVAKCQVLLQKDTPAHYALGLMLLKAVVQARCQLLTHMPCFKLVLLQHLHNWRGTAMTMPVAICTSIDITMPQSRVCMQDVASAAAGAPVVNICAPACSICAVCRARLATCRLQHSHLWCAGDASATARPHGDAASENSSLLSRHVLARYLRAVPRGAEATPKQLRHRDTKAGAFVYQ